MSTLFQRIIKNSIKIAAFSAITIAVEVAILAYRTPKLPEAPGKRTGTCKNNKHIKEVRKDKADMLLLIFGDSVAAGVGCENNQVGFAGCVAKELSNVCINKNLNWKILGKSGYTAKDCEEKLIPILERRKQKNIEKNITIKYDICVISIGVNHVLSFHSPSTYEIELTNMLKTLYNVLNNNNDDDDTKKTLILVNAMPPMEKFPQISYLKPLNLLVGYYVKLMTNVTKKVCMANEKELNTICVEWSETGIDTSTESIKKMMAPDGFHPAQPANEIMATQITEIYKSRIGRNV